MCAIALTAGSAGMIITMTLHPTGHDLLAAGRFAAMTQLATATHALGIMSAAVMFLGALGLSHHLGWSDRISIAALALYGLATITIINAAIASGFIAPAIGRRMVDAEAPNTDGWRIAFQYTGLLNQGFATVSVVGSSLAILLWSLSILRRNALSRGVGIYGCAIGPLIIIGVLSGRMRLDVHGFGAVVLAQAIWLVTVAAQLWRGRDDKRSEAARA